MYYIFCSSPNVLTGVILFSDTFHSIIKARKFLHIFNTLYSAENRIQYTFINFLKFDTLFASVNMCMKDKK